MYLNLGATFCIYTLADLQDYVITTASIKSQVKKLITSYLVNFKYVNF